MKAKAVKKKSEFAKLPTGDKVILTIAYIILGLFNTVINVILLISMNAIVKKMNDGKGI